MYTQPYLFCGRIVLIICQITQTLDGGSYINMTAYLKATFGMLTVAFVKSTMRRSAEFSEFISVIIVDTTLIEDS